MKKLKSVWNRNLIRPWIYMTLTRFGIALCAALLLNFFWKDSLRNIKQYAYTFLTLFFLGIGWVAWLRLDGIRLPKLFMKRWQPKRKPVRTYGDMVDHIDEEIVLFDALDDQEQDLCCLLSDSVCCVIFLLLAL